MPEEINLQAMFPWEQRTARLASMMAWLGYELERDIQ